MKQKIVFLLLQQRRAGKGDELGVGQTGAHKCREEVVLATVSFIDNNQVKCACTILTCTIFIKLINQANHGLVGTGIDTPNFTFTIN